jgi:hypothetical protein
MTTEQLHNKWPKMDSRIQEKEHKNEYLAITTTDNKRAALYIHKLNILLVKLRTPALCLLPHSGLINAPR